MKKLLFVIVLCFFSCKKESPKPDKCWVCDEEKKQKSEHGTSITHQTFTTCDYNTMLNYEANDKDSTWYTYTITITTTCHDSN